MTRKLEHRLQRLEQVTGQRRHRPAFIVVDSLGRPLLISTCGFGSWCADPDAYPDTVEDLRNHPPIVIDLPRYGRYITTFDTGEVVSRWETI
jgi:hypothetical protein